jgi:hypothetical protein
LGEPGAGAKDGRQQDHPGRQHRQVPHDVSSLRHTLCHPSAAAGLPSTIVPSNWTATWCRKEPARGEWHVLPDSQEQAAAEFEG